MCNIIYIKQLILQIICIINNNNLLTYNISSFQDMYITLTFITKIVYGRRRSSEL